MKHLRVATYEITSGTFEEIADKAKDGMLRTFRDQQGFIRYGVADLGNNRCMSISLWETRKQADHAVPVASEWIAKNLGDKILLKENLVGDLAFFIGAEETVTV
jgi:hypothetical protein